jgi:hypothetical protein
MKVLLLFLFSLATGVIVSAQDPAKLPTEDIGKDVRHSFLVEEDRPSIKFSTTAPNGEKATRTIIWERMK